LWQNFVGYFYGGYFKCNLNALGISNISLHANCNCDSFMAVSRGIMLKNLFVDEIIV
jgi:hypothetical protein